MASVLVVAVALLAVVVVLRLVHRRGGDRPELSPALVGMLAGGPKHALRAALVTMRRRGEVGIGKAGVLRRAGGLAETDDPLERAVYRVLGYPLGPKAIRGHRTSIEAFDVLRRGLVRAGLLLPTFSWLLVRVLPVAVVVLCVVGLAEPVTAGVIGVLPLASLLLPRRTVAGHRLLRALRREYPVDHHPDGATTGMVVAAHRTVDLPGLEKFARRGGLIDGGDSNTSEYEDVRLERPSVPLTDPNRW